MAATGMGFYQYKGELKVLMDGVKRACLLMDLTIKSEFASSNSFIIEAAQKMNWLSTNWPVKFIITADPKDDLFSLVIMGDSAMGSITQTGNNQRKADELLAYIRSFAPTDSTSSSK